MDTTQSWHSASLLLRSRSLRLIFSIDWMGSAERHRKSTNTKLLPALQKNSEALGKISQQSIERLEKLMIRTFYETQKYLGFLVCSDTHKVAGPRLTSPKIVDKDSACMNLPNEKPPTPISA